MFHLYERPRMNNKYCLPIIKRTRNEVQQTIEANLDRFRYFERVRSILR